MVPLLRLVSKVIYRKPQVYFLPRVVLSINLKRGMGQGRLSKEWSVQVLDGKDPLREGELREVSLSSDSEKILLVRHKGEIRALSSKCTHYNAPLVKGTYDSDSGSIRCPFHGACFDVETGDIEDYPGLDGLSTYEVLEKEDGGVWVRGKDFKTLKRPYPPMKRDPKDDRLALIVGGGPAAQVCAEVLRSPNVGFTGRVLMISGENNLPYDRPKLSKALGATVDEIQLRPKEFYKKRDIETSLGVKLVSLVPSEKKAVLSDGTSHQYHKILLATGTSPRRLVDLPGQNLKNIFVLRTPEDANEIFEKSKEKSVVIIGGSYIGTETASFLAGKASKVTIVGSSQHLFEKTLGKDIGDAIRSMHEAKGVEFALGKTPKEFRSSTGNCVESVLLSDGSEISADVVVLGVGVLPNSTEYLKNSEIETDEKGYIIVNEKMETNIADVYAAGDTVKFPLFTHNNQKFSIGHWAMAKSHGKIAAYNMFGSDKVSSKKCLKSVPFFWTVQYGKSVRMAGFVDSYDEVVYDGEVESGKFAAFYIREDKVIGVSTLMRDPLAAKFADLLKKEITLKKTEIQSFLA